MEIIRVDRQSKNGSSEKTHPASAHVRRRDSGRGVGFLVAHG